jgi:hypothetical protein
MPVGLGVWLAVDIIVLAADVCIVGEGVVGDEADTAALGLPVAVPVPVPDPVPEEVVVPLGFPE